MTAPTVALDARFLAGERKGIGRYLHNLLSGMGTLPDAPDFYLVTDVTQDMAYAGLRLTTVQVKSWSVYAWEQAALPRVLRSLGADVFHAVGNAVPWSPLRGTVLTLHDAMMFEHTLVGRRANRYYWYQAQVLKRAARHCDAVITVSETSANDIVGRVGNGVGAKLRVIPNAVDPLFFNAVAPPDLERFRRLYNLPDRYVLHLGAALPRKNTKMLIDAYVGTAGLPPLVIGGLAAADITAVGAWVPPHADVRLVEYLPAEEHALLVAGAWALIFPSSYEGFGMPALEAMAAGVPVLAAATGALPEVCGGAALMAPAEVGALREALRRISEDAALRTALVAAGRRRAEDFSPAEMAAATLQVYRDVMTA